MLCSSAKDALAECVKEHTPAIDKVRFLSYTTLHPLHQVLL